MKKVLVLAALFALVATPVFATSIVGSPHDLSGTVGVGTDELCVFCHTPHAAATTAPLWNRNDVGVTADYNSITFDATSASTSDAPLCLSCHDGASLATAVLVNEPNAGVTDQGVIAALLDTDTNLGTDLSNDHPVGILYDVALSVTDTGINSPAGLDPAIGLFGAGNDMWCSSCHDVHDNAIVPFLVMSNSGSALCLECHNK